MTGVDAAAKDADARTGQVGNALPRIVCTLVEQAPIGGDSIVAEVERPGALFGKAHADQKINLAGVQAFLALRPGTVNIL